MIIKLDPVRIIIKDPVTILNPRCVALLLSITMMIAIHNVGTSCVHLAS